MSKKSTRCQANNKSGSRCKNNAQSQSSYCHIHAKVASHDQQAQLEALTTELNQLAAEVRVLEEKFTPPPFSTQGMIRLLKENMSRFTPEMRLSLISELQESFEGAAAKDFLDPDTWKGMWYILNYSAQNNTESLRHALADRLAHFPGYDLAQDFRNSLEGASPKDFLEIDTWKGVWFMATYSLRFEADKMKNQILGKNDIEEDE